MSLKSVDNPEEDAPILYANNVGMAAGPFDCCLNFALADGSGQAPPKDVVKVCISPQNAKMLAGMMRQYIENYEKNIGTIALPKDVQDQLDGSGE